MKKLAAIFLLSTFMLNLVGYRAWYYFELKSADENMAMVLENKDYLETDLVTIRIPLSLPYQTDTDDFESVSGEVNYGGKIYKYVKRKMENGFFVLKCLPDYQKMQVEREKNHIVKNNLHQTQHESGKPASGNNLLKYVFSEFDQHTFTIKINTSYILANTFGTYHEPALFSLRTAAPGQPPDQVS